MFCNQLPIYYVVVIIVGLTLNLYAKDIVMTSNFTFKYKYVDLILC